MSICATRSPFPPALLCDATWYGTLAAARDLGSRGVRVTLASDALVAPARWSRYVDRTVSCPKSKEAARFVEWLLAFGEREPGHVLYPTSDEVAWHVAAHREALSKRFLLYSPPLDTFVRILDKLRLADEGRAAGLDVAETYCPEDEAALERLGRQAQFPLLVKPRAQVLSEGFGKVTPRVDGPEALKAAWRSWCDGVRYHRQVRERIPGVERPLLQVCYPGAECVHTVDGFIDESGLLTTRGCTKLLQRPRRSGPGILFEDAPVDDAVEEGLRRLCRATGFHGVFDVEFLEHRGRKLLIDFNPRFYNHMAFEIDRGLPLPWLAYLGALGDREALRAAVVETKAVRSERRAYVHRLPTEMMLGVQSLSGAMPRGERRRWRRWMADHDGRVTDPAHRENDRWPAVAEVAMEILGFARHPRTYVRRLSSGGDEP